MYHTTHECSAMCGSVSDLVSPFRFVFLRWFCNLVVLIEVVLRGCLPLLYILCPSHQILPFSYPTWVLWVGSAHLASKCEWGFVPRGPRRHCWQQMSERNACIAVV
jgi:hypothetical protein